MAEGRLKVKPRDNFSKVREAALDTLGGLPVSRSLTKSEHHDRIAEWTKTTHTHKSKEVEDERMAAHSMLIDEGVRRLKNWDQEMIMHATNNPLSPITGGSRMSEGAKLNLMAELSEIKKAVDPEDKITSRVIVQEFEKFMENKKITEPTITNKKPKESKNYIDKKVQFQQNRGERTEDDLEVREKDWRQKAMNVGFTVTYPKRATRKGNDKGLSSLRTDKGTKQLEGSPNTKDPDWWRRKIRQGFIQTDEMMSKLVNQRRQEELVIHGAIQETPGMELTRSYRYEEPKTYASIAARATRMERLRLNKSMERLKKRHDACFGPNCPNNKEDDNSADADEKRRPKSHDPEGARIPNYDPIPILATLTSRFPADRPPAPNKNDEYADKMKKLLSFAPVKPQNNINESIKTAENKGIFKAPNSTKVKGHDDKKKKAEVEVIYTRHTEAQSQIDRSDHKMGSERWPQEYLDVHHHNKSAKKNTAISISGNDKSGNKEWMKQFVEVHKKKIEKDEAEQKAIMEKRKAERNALYQELLFNKNKLQNEVEIERRRMQMSWKFSSQNSQKKVQNARDKLPNRFGPYNEDDEKKGAKEVLEYSWKERPKGLNLWLEGVMAKAKDDKELKARNKAKDNLMPLSSYQF